MYFVVAYAYSGLSPVRARPWRANYKRAPVLMHKGFFFIQVIIFKILCTAVSIRSAGSLLRIHIFVLGFTAQEPYLILSKLKLFKNFHRIFKLG